MRDTQLGEPPYSNGFSWVAPMPSSFFRAAGPSARLAKQHYTSTPGPHLAQPLGGAMARPGLVEACATEVTKRCAQDTSWFGVERSMVLWYGPCMWGDDSMMTRRPGSIVVVLAALGGCVPPLWAADDDLRLPAPTLPVASALHEGHQSADALAVLERRLDGLKRRRPAN